MNEPFLSDGEPARRSHGLVSWKPVDYTTEMLGLNTILGDESVRNREFPVTAERVYMSHAGVCPLPRCAAEAIAAFADEASRDNQENGWEIERMDEVRTVAARLIDAKASEIALLGPTSMGLSLVAHGLDWAAGDEVVFYPDDYPANVYPWRDLKRHGVKSVELSVETPGRISWEDVERALSEKTKLVSLASCHYLTGYRVDLDGIGKYLHDRGILFCVDAIQTVGAFPTSVRHIDFLSADSHKWMLGPAAAGIFYVAEEHHDRLRPTLLGSFNVYSPEFIAQDTLRYYDGARRYEPGMLNLPGIIGMEASMKLLLEIGVDAIAPQLRELRLALTTGLQSAGFEIYPTADGIEDEWRSGIVTVYHPSRKSEEVFALLHENNIVASMRHNRAGDALLRFSPHFYNTMKEVDRVLQTLS